MATSRIKLHPTTIKLLESPWLITIDHTRDRDIPKVERITLLRAYMAFRDSEHVKSARRAGAEKRREYGKKYYAKSHSRILYSKAICAFFNDVQQEIYGKVIKKHVTVNYSPLKAFRCFIRLCYAHIIGVDPEFYRKPPTSDDYYRLKYAIWVAQRTRYPKPSHNFVMHAWIGRAIRTMERTHLPRRYFDVYFFKDRRTLSRKKRSSRHYWENRDVILAKRAKKYRENIEEERRLNRERYHRNIQRNRERSKLYYARNRVRILEVTRQRRLKKKESIKE